eukprot:11177838-Lingulodinium_polyedra.AAC.1
MQRYLASQICDPLDAPRPDADVTNGVVNRQNLPTYENWWTRQLTEQQRRAGRAADALDACISSFGSRVQQDLAAVDQDQID